MKVTRFETGRVEIRKDGEVFVQRRGKWEHYRIDASGLEIFAGYFTQEPYRTAFDAIATREHEKAQQAYEAAAPSHEEWLASIRAKFSPV